MSNGKVFFPMKVYENYACAEGWIIRPLQCCANFKMFMTSADIFCPAGTQIISEFNYPSN